MMRMPPQHNTTNPPGQIINRAIRCKMGQTCTCQKGICEDAPVVHHDRPLTQEIDAYFKEQE